MQNYPDGRRYEGFYKLDRRHGFGIYSMPDQSTYSGGWLDGKQHGYGVVYNNSGQGQLKFGLWRHGQKLFKLTSEEANSIQDGELDLMNTNRIQQSLGDEKHTFWADINVLTNKFEPFNTFATEQAKFELNKCTQQERAAILDQGVRDSNIV